MQTTSKSYPYAINVDWLQVYCHDSNVGLLNHIYYESSAYEFVLQEHGSRHFREIWNVLNSDGEKYAVIQRCPHSSVLSKDGSIVQLCNRELYRPNYASEFIVFLASHKFKYKSISRLDICFDSNYLLKKLSHSKLIKDIMMGVVLKNNQAKVNWNFNAIANVGAPMECNSCSFGSKSSSVSTKMYNKTLEMKEQKNKPYIVESWIYNGIDIERDVWRIEISIKSDASTTIRTESGEIFRLTPDSLKMQTIVEDVFFSYAAKYFSFKKNNNTKNKTRMPDLEIFPKERTLTLRPVRITNEKDSGRADRIFLKKLHTLLNGDIELDKEAWDAVIEVSNVFTLQKSLSAWRKKKLGEAIYHKGFDQADYASFQKRIEGMIQELLERHPKAAESIHELMTLIFTILNKK